MTIEGLRIISPPDLGLYDSERLDSYFSELQYDLPFGVINPATGKPSFSLTESIDQAVAATRKADEALGTVVYQASRLHKVWVEKPDAFDRLSPEQKAQAMELISRLVVSEDEPNDPQA